MKKKSILIIIAIGISAFALYYFQPKTASVCGNILPIECIEYKCERGFIHNPAPFGGMVIECSLGGEPIYIQKYLLKNL